MVLFGAIGGMSYRYLREVELKQHFVEIADDLNNAVLEARRYERNYLLYGSVQDLAANHQFVHEALMSCEKCLPGSRISRGPPSLSAWPRKSLFMRPSWNG
jgi:hypothetical protein